MKAVLKFIESGKLGRHEASSIRGRIQYADSHTFSRMARFGMHELAERAEGESGGTRVSRELETNSAWISFYLSAAKPRIIKPGQDFPPVIIYTDGAYEPAEGSKSRERGLATMGGVLIDMHFKIFLTFGTKISDATVGTSGSFAGAQFKS